MFRSFQIIIGELCFSLLKLYYNIHYLIRFCKQLPDDDLKRSKHVGVFLIFLIVFMWNLYKCNCWLIIEAILQNARCNNKIYKHNKVISGIQLDFILQLQILLCFRHCLSVYNILVFVVQCNCIQYLTDEYRK